MRATANAADRAAVAANDPVVLAHARALLAGGPDGRTDYVDADFRNPAQILEQAAKTADFGRPVALMVPVHHRRAAHAAPVPEQPDA